MNLRRLRRATLLVPAVLAQLAGCGSDVSPGSGGEGGGAGTGGEGGATSTSSTSASTTSSSTSSGQGGEAPCGETDSECICAACEAEGGTCLDYCNFPPFKACYFPEPVGEGQFSCGGAVTCSDDEACVRGTPMGDGCDTYACEQLPAACVEDPTCACVESHIADPFFEPSCQEEDGHLVVVFPGGPPDPPFVEGEVCGDLTCRVGEHCVSCEDSEFPDEFFSHDCVLDEVPAGSFRCGTTVCLEGIEYCDHDPGFEPCLDSYACRPLPDCPSPCDCIDLSACLEGTCGEDADGNVVVECYEG